jgi:hypothetical protein
MPDSYGLVSNTLPRVYNPPPGWDEELVSWQAANVGWAPPSAGWTPDSPPGARPAPAGWQFWVINPILVAQQRRLLAKRAWGVIGIGSAIFVAGLVASLIGANLAAGGGVFIIFTGLMIVGLARVVFGVIRLARASSMAKDLVMNRKL